MSDKSWEPELEMFWKTFTFATSQLSQLSLSHSLSMCWTTFVFMYMLKSHSHEIKSCSACGEWVNDRVKEWDIERVREWLLSIDMKTKVVQYDMREWETALQPCNLFIFQQNFEALGVVFHPPPQNVKLGSGVKLLKSFGLIQIGLLCDELWP